MKNVNCKLLEVINKELDEAAKSFDQINEPALMIDNSFGSISFVVYQPNLIKQAIEIKKKHNIIPSREIIKQIHPEAILGYIKMGFSSECNSYEILESAAIKGYGPLVYDIAMAYSAKKGIMSDREALSGTAHNIWNHYYTARRKELKIIKLPEDCVEENMPPYLKVKYVALNPIQYGQYETAHKNFLSSEEIPDVDKLILSLAGSFFFQQYKKRN